MRVSRLRHALIGMVSVLTLALLLPIEKSSAEVRINITRGHLEPLPIAITEFFGADRQSSETGVDIATVISGNLERSGLFKPIEKGAFLQKPADLRVQPRYSDWRVINAQALVNGSVKLQPD